MTREVQGVLLVLFGGALLRISAGDVYLRYVKEGMRPWLLLSGALLILAGALVIINAIRSSRSDDQPHDHHGPRSAWMLLLPVAAIFLVAPPALGAFTAAREDSSVAQPASAPPLPAGDPVTVTLADYASRAVWDDGRTLVNRTVQMTGFVTPNPAGGWWLTRLQLACCAADAIPTKIVPVDAPGDLAANTWVTITGTWVPGGGTQTETAIPWVKVLTLTEVPQPSNAYE
jgi:uncharacterized repeat protein (TIGR03943 family)